MRIIVRRACVRERIVIDAACRAASRLGRIIFDSDLVQILQMINTPVIRRYIAFNVIKLDVDIFAYE